MEPGQAALGALEMIQLRLLPNPENTEREEAHHVHEQTWCKGGHALQQIMFTVDRFAKRNVQIEHEQCHAYGKYSVTERGQPLNTLSSDAVVGSGHARRV